MIFNFKSPCLEGKHVRHAHWQKENPLHQAGRLIRLTLGEGRAGRKMEVKHGHKHTQIYILAERRSCYRSSKTGSNNREDETLLPATRIPTLSTFSCARSHIPHTTHRTGKSSFLLFTCGTGWADFSVSLCATAVSQVHIVRTLKQFYVYDR